MQRLSKYSLNTLAVFWFWTVCISEWWKTLSLLWMRKSVRLFVVALLVSLSFFITSGQIADLIVKYFFLIIFLIYLLFLYSLHRVYTLKYLCVKIIYKLYACIKWGLKKLQYKYKICSYILRSKSSMAIQGAQNTPL